MPPVGFEPAIPAGGRPQTYALDRIATGTGKLVHLVGFIVRIYHDARSPERQIA